VSTQATLDQIQEIYISYYGRPADADGLIYWAAQLDANNGNLAGIIDAFANSTESATLYGANSSPTDLITAIYQNVLHRAPDADGLAFYVQALKDGTFTAGSLALSVLNGAQNSDATLVQNELAAANQFTAAATTYSGDTAAAIGRTFISLVSTDDSANATLQSHFTDFINAASTATTDPSQFDGDISNGVLTNPPIIYPNDSGSTGNGSTDSGSTGGDSSGGGSSGGDAGNNPPPTTTFHLVNTDGTVGFNNASGTVTIDSITEGANGARTIHAHDGSSATDTLTVPGDGVHVVLEGFSVADGQTLEISDDLVNGWTVTGTGTGTVHVTSSDGDGTYDLTEIKTTGALTIDADTTATFVLTLSEAGNASLAEGQHYILSDSATNFSAFEGNDSLLVNATSCILTDTAANLASALQSADALDLVRVQSIVVTDAASVAQALAFQLPVSANANALHGTLTLEQGLSDDAAAFATTDGTLATNVSELLALHPHVSVGDLATIAQIEAIENAGATQVIYSLTDGHVDLGWLAVADVDPATAAAQAVVESASNANPVILDATYELVDSLANLEDAGSGVLSGAAGYALSEDQFASLGSLSVSNAKLAQGAMNFAMNDYSYTLSDTVANLMADDASTAIFGHNVTVTDNATIAAIEGIEQAGATRVSYSLINGSVDLGTLAVADVATAISAAQEVADHASNASPVALDATYSITDTISDLTANGASAVIAGHDVTVTGNASITQIEQIENVVGDNNVVTYSLTDGNISLGVLAVADVESATAAAQAVVENASNAPLVTLHATYSLNDSVANLEGADSDLVSGATSITITDLVTNLTASDAGAIIAGHDVTVIDGATIAVIEAIEQAGALRVTYDLANSNIDLGTDLSVQDARDAALTAQAVVNGATRSATLHATYTLNDTVAHLTDLQSQSVLWNHDVTISDSSVSITDISEVQVLANDGQVIYGTVEDNALALIDGVAYLAGHDVIVDDNISVSDLSTITTAAGVGHVVDGTVEDYVPALMDGVANLAGHNVVVDFADSDTSLDAADLVSIDNNVGSSHTVDATSATTITGISGNVAAVLTDTTQNIFADHVAVTLTNQSFISTEPDNLVSIIEATDGEVDASALQHSLTFNLGDYDGTVNFIGGQDGNNIVAGTGNESLDLSPSSSTSNTIDVSNIFTNGNVYVDPITWTQSIPDSLTISGFNTGVGNVSDTLEFGTTFLVAAVSRSVGINGTTVDMAVSNGIVEFTNGAPSSLSVAITAAKELMTSQNGATPAIDAFEYSGSTYVVATNSNENATVIKLAGVTGASTLAQDEGSVHIFTVALG
jgi:Domain of unknown function (DUF4214)